MTSSLVASFAQQVNELELYLRTEYQPATPEGHFVLHVYESVNESGPVSAWGSPPPVEELRQGRAPTLAAASLMFSSPSGTPTPAHLTAWEDGIRRLSGRNAFPVDRQTFAFRPIEAYGIALGVIRLLPVDHKVRAWFKEVFTRLEEEVGDDPSAHPLYAATASLLGVTWTPRKEGGDSVPEELALRRWLLLSRPNSGQEIAKAVGELDSKLLRATVLMHLAPADVAKAALLHHALRRAVHERLESDLKAAWLTRQDTADAVAIIINLCRRFPLFARQIQIRHDKRKSIIIKDEYDVQDAMNALLKLHFDDVRAEEWSPSYAATASRIDFLLKREKVVIEVKMTRKTLGQKEVANQLIQDKERYRTHPDYRTLVCFVFDPAKYLNNPVALESDVSEEEGDFRVVTIVSPSGI